MYSFSSMEVFVLGLTVAFAFCMWYVWNGAPRSLVKHEALRKEFKTASMLRDVLSIMFAGVFALILFALAGMINLGPGDALYILLSTVSIMPILFVVISRIYQVFSKLKWAIEIDRLPQVSGKARYWKPIQSDEHVPCLVVTVSDRGDVEFKVPGNHESWGRIDRLVHNDVAVFYQQDTDGDYVAKLIVPTGPVAKA